MVVLLKSIFNRLITNTATEVLHIILFVLVVLQTILVVGGGAAAVQNFSEF